jgi:hypothetical protein
MRQQIQLREEDICPEKVIQTVALKSKSLSIGRFFGFKAIATALTAAHSVMLNSWTGFGFKTIIF